MLRCSIEVKKVKVEWHWFKKRENGPKRSKQANMDLTSSGETNQGSRWLLK